MKASHFEGQESRFDMLQTVNQKNQEKQPLLTIFHLDIND